MLLAAALPLVHLQQHLLHLLHPNPAAAAAALLLHAAGPVLRGWLLR
jgi:hypothetical protein